MDQENTLDMWFEVLGAVVVVIRVFAAVQMGQSHGVSACIENRKKKILPDQLETSGLFVPKRNQVTL